jgi:hypothetical protein
MKEIRVLAERWRVHYNTIGPHSSLGYRPPAPEAWDLAASRETTYQNVHAQAGHHDQGRDLASAKA